MTKKIRNKWQAYTPTAGAVASYLEYSKKLDDLLSGLSANDQLSLLIQNLVVAAIDAKSDLRNICIEIFDTYNLRLKCDAALKRIRKKGAARK